MQPDVYDRLRGEIVTGEFEPAAPLGEEALAQRYGTSRTPVREALRRREQDGLVERGARGMRARARSLEEILEIYEVRVPLEATVTAAAVQRRTELDLIRVRAAQTAMDGAGDSEPTALAAANRAVHEAIWAAGHNGTLIDLLVRLNNHLTRYPATTLAVPGRWAEARKEQEAIIAAIADRDSGRASELAGAHMSRARELRLRIWTSAEPG
ncbi:MAG TPA: GntR family transcriptional regulator [Trebonia sp.]